MCPIFLNQNCPLSRFAPAAGWPRAIARPRPPGKIWADQKIGINGQLLAWLVSILVSILNPILGTLPPCAPTTYSVIKESIKNPARAGFIVIADLLFVREWLFPSTLVG